MENQSNISTLPGVIGEVGTPKGTDGVINPACIFRCDGVSCPIGENRGDGKGAGDLCSSIVSEVISTFLCEEKPPESRLKMGDLCKVQDEVSRI